MLRRITSAVSAGMRLLARSAGETVFAEKPVATAMSLRRIREVAMQAQSLAQEVRRCIGSTPIDGKS